MINLNELMEQFMGEDHDHGKKLKDGSPTGDLKEVSKMLSATKKRDVKKNSGMDGQAKKLMIISMSKGK